MNRRFFLRLLGLSPVVASVTPAGSADDGADLAAGAPVYGPPAFAPDGSFLCDCEQDTLYVKRDGEWVEVRKSEWLEDEDGAEAIGVPPSEIQPILREVDLSRGTEIVFGKSAAPHLRNRRFVVS